MHIARDISMGISTHLVIVVVLLVFVLTLIPFVLLLLDLLDFRRLQQTSFVLLELVPPSSNEKSAHATGQLFSILHDLYSRQSLAGRLLRHKNVLSLEIVSSREQGIRYIAWVPEVTKEAFQQAVASYLPGIRFRVVEYYFKPLVSGWSQLVEFKLARHFAFSLQQHDALAQHDPVAYMAGAMTHLEPNEVLVLQLVLSPAYPREARRLYNRLLIGEEPSIVEEQWKLPLVVVYRSLCIFGDILLAICGLIGEIAMPSRAYKSPQKLLIPRTKAYQELTDKRLSKLSQPLFRTDVRVYGLTRDKQRVMERMSGLTSSLASFSCPGFQSLTPKQNLLLRRFKRWQKFSHFKLLNRLPSVLPSRASLLSAKEVASIYHFPYGNDARPENLVISFSKTLAAPAVMKQRADKQEFDVVLGRNRHHGAETAIGLTTQERERHVYIIGGTGNGKTTILEHAIAQDIQNGKGVALIDPHGDSARRLLGHVPESRLNDVIYLNPRDLEYPIGINLLELPTGLTGSDLLHEKDLVAEAVISVLGKVFDSDGQTNAYRIERILRNAVHTAFTVEGATIFTVLQLLTDASFRKQIARQLTDESLKRFWKEELGKAGEFQRVKFTSGPISRIERYERSEATKRMLGQAKSTINFDNIMNSGKILICNFSKGSLGEDTSTLFGATVLAKLQLAAWRRDMLPESKRRPFYLYVDEFQNFASESFMGLFSEARKYKLFLTIAQQSVAQLHDPKMITTILDNVGTVVAFRSKSPETERILLHQFSPYVEPGEIGNLPSYNFYMKVGAVNPQEPMSGETVVLASEKHSKEFARKVVEASRNNYAIEYKQEANNSPSDKKITEPKNNLTPQLVSATESVALPVYDGS